MEDKVKDDKLLSKPLNAQFKKLTGVSIKDDYEKF